VLKVKSLSLVSSRTLTPTTYSEVVAVFVAAAAAANFGQLLIVG
jgi:hypothetical protein